MAASTDDAALAQVAYLQLRLHEAESRRATVLAALSDAQDAFERTKAVMATLSAEETALRASCSTLRSDMDSLRSELERVRLNSQAARVQKILAKFPRELLQLIFREARCFGDKYWPERDDDWRHDDDYNFQHCVMPFTLSAVNGRWREVALNTADLWNRIQVPCLDDSDGSVFLAYVRILLRRSKNRDLYVLLPWAEPCDWSKSDYYARILKAIGNHVHRLRKFNMTVPIATPENALQFLRLPMLRLEELCLLHSNRGPGRHLVNYADSLFSYLPICPTLRRLYNEVVFSVPPRPYTELIHLYLDIANIPMSYISLVLAQCPSLQCLELNFVEEPDVVEDGQHEFLVLSNLRVLGISGYHSRFAEWIHCAQLPQLHELRLVDFDDVASLVPVLEKVAETVATLVLKQFTLDDHLRAEDMQHIQKLRQVRHVVFDFCSYLGHDIPNIFSTRESAGFPHLESITIEDPEFDDEQANHASRMMHKLHAMSLHLPERAMVFTLKAKPEHVPDWLIQQYEFICGNGDGGAVTGANDDASDSDSAHSDSSDESEET